MTKHNASLTIGALSKRVEVSIDTIRFYEREGLLSDPPRRPSGYRSYDESAVTQLCFIRRAKGLGFTLEEIRELLALSHDRRKGVRAVKQRAQHRLSEIDTRIAELQRVRNGLAQLVEACPGHGSPDQCPILRTLSGEDAPV